MNYFALFGLPEQFEIDLEKLNTTYKTLAQLTHPDKFANAGASEKLMVVQKNAQVNDGYQTLKRPLARAEHLLSIRGIELNHEQKTMQDNLFLMQQMEWREQLEDVERASDPLLSLTNLEAEIKGSFKSHLDVLANLLEKNTNEANILSGDEIRKLKFLDKLQKEIALKEDALADID